MLITHNTCNALRFIFIQLTQIFSISDDTPGTSQAVQESGVSAQTEEPCKN